MACTTEIHIHIRLLSARMSGHLHAADIAFRDLKPENILFGMDGHIRLTGANLCTPERNDGLSLYVPRFRVGEAADFEDDGRRHGGWHKQLLPNCIPALRPPTERRLNLIPRTGYPAYDLKSTYCFCAHMHEMMKYFLLTENQ